MAAVLRHLQGFAQTCAVCWGWGGVGWDTGWGGWGWILTDYSVDLSPTHPPVVIGVAQAGAVSWGGVVAVS